MTVEELLGRLAQLRSGLARAEERTEALRKQVLRPVQPKLDAIDRQHEDAVTPLRERVEELEAKVRERVVSLGRNVREGGLLAVYVPPKVTWDKKQLDALAAVYPAIKVARDEAEAGTCQIRSTKEGGK